MENLEKVLEEQSGDLIDVLTFDAGMSRGQAEVFLREAGPALLDSYRWQASELHSDLASPSSVRDLLAGINGRELAPRVGLPASRTWDGLRALVPAVVRSGVGTNKNPEATRFDIGFGLTFEPRRSDAPGGDAESSVSSVGSVHPVFGRLLSNPSARS